jgi:DnaJ-class molecular chaperone
VRSPYETLGVAVGADEATLKKAYRKLAKQSHPDTSAESTERFHRIQEAYELLTDPDRRHEWEGWQRTQRHMERIYVHRGEELRGQDVEAVLLAMV